MFLVLYSFFLDEAFINSTVYHFKNVQNNSQHQQTNRRNSNPSESSKNNSSNFNKITKKQTLVEKLSSEKCEVILTLQLLKQNIEEIEMRQNEAIREVSFLFLI